MSRPLILSLLLVASAGTALAPAQPVETRAPFEILADGFDSLRGLVVGEDGAVHVADRAAGTITRIEPDGRRTVVADHLDGPVGLALEADGRLLVAEEHAGRVARLDAGGLTAIVQGLARPRWLAVSDNGTLYVSARRPGLEAEVEPDDESVEPDAILALVPGGALRVFADGFASLQGIAAHGDALYAVARGLRADPAVEARVYRLPVLPDGQAGPLQVVAGHEVRRPAGIVVDRLGALYVTAGRARLDGERHRRPVLKVAPGGTVTLFAAPLEHPRGLALDPRGHLYVADGQRVLRFLAPPAPVMAALPEFTRHPALAVGGVTLPGARVDVLPDHDRAPVSVLATEDGRFEATIALAPNTGNAIGLLATAAGGEGLTSEPVQIGVVHDGIAPVAMLQAPVPGALLRGAVPVLAEAADAGSAVAAIQLTAAGQPLGTTLEPAPPAPAVGATAFWPTAGLPDGAHTLTLTAIDRAGNGVTVGRAVVVDNTPPETEITAGPAGTVQETAVTFTLAGADNLTPAPDLQYAWRLDGGPWSPFGSETLVALTDVAPGDHLFEAVARDRAGNDDASPAARVFTVLQPAALEVTITEPLNGAQVPRGSVLVRGTVSEPGAAVSVNGLAALVHGQHWAVEVYLDAGDHTLAAVAVARSGAEGTATAHVTSGGDEPVLVLRAEPRSGVAPLTVTWQVRSRSPRPLVQFELDPTGAGAFGTPVPALDGAQHVYTTSGLHLPAVRATDDQGAVHVARTALYVEEPQSAAARFQALWDDFKVRLLAGDIAGALDYLMPGLRPRFEPVFQQLGPDLPVVAAALGPIALIDAVDDLAEAAIVQEEDGTPFLYFVYFRRDNRGRWLIQEM